MSRLVIIIAVLFLLWLGLRWFIRTPPQQVVKDLKKYGLYAAIGVVVLLAMTGRLNWIFAAVAAAIPLFQRALGMLRFLPLIQGVMGRAKAAKAARGPSQGQQSTVETRMLRMTLDHDTGDMDGEVLDGTYADRLLSQLSLPDLLSLRQECRRLDGESVALLDAYLDRSRPDWRDEVDVEAEDTHHPGSAQTGMTADEARQILNVSEHATEQEILQAHRRLMHKLHPDRGGSDYLAAKINLAKDCLLGQGKPR